MKIIGLSASPRKKGNTAWAVNTILDGAKEQGAAMKLLAINPLNAFLICQIGQLFFSGLEIWSGAISCLER